MKSNSTEEWNDWKIVGVEPTNVNGKITDWGIHFLAEGPYKDTVIVIGELAIKEIDSDEQGMLSFDYELFHNPNDIVASEDPEFENYIGDIIVSTLTKALDEGNAVLNEREPEQDHPTITLNQ